MTVMAAERDTAAEIRAWRWEQLMDLGFTPQDAELIAEVLPADRSWHEFERLIRLGLEPEKALEMLL